MQKPAEPPTERFVTKMAIATIAIQPATRTHFKKVRSFAMYLPNRDQIKTRRNGNARF
jgi:hypothetical protein